MDNNGLFNLEELIGWPIIEVKNYFNNKGWETVDCFKDYKWAFINLALNISIICKVEIIDNEKLCNEIVVDIWHFEGIYKEF